ncbi:MmcQ/YjbR family DNA-binding protein [Flavobacterium amniphilum]|uniref:MmcQ/YjbR family DNA-binding protein n=1 Tax=Flavobacterium amniphilum TaxID=1834035 RepID=UPI00202A173A|nr:MmcQ/YjbR family DNA-binding protein [Flavobacterium amniphilum]MCL9805901.1 MmcQ/YjbR family DNA-binding protein [Flavobacterium amniphilum]
MMDIETLQQICKALPHVTEDIKWGNDLCFCIGTKMFCVVGLNQSPTSASFKVTEEEFETMSTQPGIKPAPYVAKYKWVLVENINTLSLKEWKHFTGQSYNLVKDKLPPKIKKELNLL